MSAQKMGYCTVQFPSIILNAAYAIMFDVVIANPLRSFLLLYSFFIYVATVDNAICFADDTAHKY